MNAGYTVSGVTDLPSYPITLRLSGRKVVVVGGGPLATRRALGLVDAGADVIVIAPEATDAISFAAESQSLTWLHRPYESGDLDGAWFVQTATGKIDVDRRVEADAEVDRIWCVRTGDAANTAAWTPAVARVDDVIVAVNAGADPKRAVALRDAISNSLQAGDFPLARFRKKAAGTVALVGGGPGDAGLLTSRARRLLANADVIVIDRLAPHSFLEEIGDDVLVIDVGKTPGHHPVPQEEINALLVKHALEGRNVVRLKGGDPFVFGRGSEELIACREAGVPVEVVPGVTSAISVPAAAGIPVTHRGISRGFTVLTGHEDVGNIPTATNHTLVLLMGVKRLGETCAGLIEHGRSPDTPVAVVEDGYGPRQRVTVGTLTTIAAKATEVGVTPPAVTVVGDVVRLSPAWND